MRDSMAIVRAVVCFAAAALASACYDARQGGISQGGVLLWQADGYAAPGETIALDLAKIGALEWHVDKVSASCPAIGLGPAVVYDGGPAPNWSYLKPEQGSLVGVLTGMEAKRIEVPIPASATPGVVELNLDVEWHAAVSVGAGRQFEVVEKRHTLATTVRVVRTGRELATRAVDLGILLAELAGLGLLLGILAPVSSTAPGLAKTLWTAFGLLVAAALLGGLPFFALPAARALGWTMWWARAAVFAVGAILCSIIASTVMDARERRASAKTGAQ